MAWKVDLCENLFCRVLVDRESVGYVILYSQCDSAVFPLLSQTGWSARAESGRRTGCERAHREGHNIPAQPEWLRRDRDTNHRGESTHRRIHSADARADVVMIKYLSASNVLMSKGDLRSDRSWIQLPS